MHERGKIWLTDAEIRLKFFTQIKYPCTKIKWYETVYALNTPHVEFLNYHEASQSSERQRNEILIWNLFWPGDLGL